MSATRFNYTAARTAKNLEQSTGPGRYMIDVPGNGVKPCFMVDPAIRLQQWGANLRSNPVDLESALMGIDNRSSIRDCTVSKNPIKESDSKKVEYPTCGAFTEQPRASHPAWEVRDAQQKQFDYLPHDPQANTCIPFRTNVSTRILEKDYFVASVPNVSSNDDGLF